MVQRESFNASGDPAPPSVSVEVEFPESLDAMSEKVSETVTLAPSWRPDTWVGGIYRIDSSGIDSWSA